MIVLGHTGSKWRKQASFHIGSSFTGEDISPNLWNLSPRRLVHWPPGKVSIPFGIFQSSPPAHLGISAQTSIACLKSELVGKNDPSHGVMGPSFVSFGLEVERPCTND